MKQISDRVMVDADVCINLSVYDKKNALRSVFSNIASKVYFHEYIYEQEIVNSGLKSEIAQLISDGIVEVLKPQSILNGKELANYLATAELLSDSFGVTLQEKTSVRNDHKGEILTIALAKTLGIHVILSNERCLQREIQDSLNIGQEDIKICRMEDIVLWIKENSSECGLSRKDAQFIWISSFDKSKLDKKKAYFNDKLWPQN